MTQEEKARLYDDYVRQGDVLQREISKIKSQYPINMPEKEKNIIQSNIQKINNLELKLQKLFH
jgi:hypothetical protein